MRPIPPKLKEEILADPYYKKCARQNSECAGRLTWEHCWEYGSEGQINEKWAIIPLCWFHHLGLGLKKEINQWISVNRMTKEDMLKYPRKKWEQIKKYLNSKYAEGQSQKSNNEKEVSDM